MERMSSVFHSANICLSDEQMKMLLVYYDMLIERNKVMNLTAITNFEDVLVKHFRDSLAPLSNNILAESFQKHDNKILDLGSGAGFPGIPLAIALPDAEFTLADSLQKRCGFLEDVKNELHLDNVYIINGRAEDLGRNPEHREQYDIVVSRAVADLRVLCEYCLPFVKEGGTFASWKGPQVTDELKQAENAVSVLGGDITQTYPYSLPVDGGERSIVQITKTGMTPEKYPRRSGIPSKRPL